MPRKKAEREHTGWENAAGVAGDLWDTIKEDGFSAVQVEGSRPGEDPRFVVKNPISGQEYLICVLPHIPQLKMGNTTFTARIEMPLCLSEQPVNKSRQTDDEKRKANPRWCGMPSHHESCDCGGAGGDR
jgi:hypothetical protein